MDVYKVWVTTFTHKYQEKAHRNTYIHKCTYSTFCHSRATQCTYECVRDSQRRGRVSGQAYMWLSVGVCAEKGYNGHQRAQSRETF